jgi:glycosyltransferase involved in cell wall biosynthesis
MKPLLTIAIPTYNRATKLRAQLERLLPQLHPEVRVCVYDNASTDDTRQVVEPFLSKGVFYFCAGFNGGGNLNFLRCFEGCETEWLWILSDDDQISATAVKDAVELVKGCRADFIHTSTPISPHKENVTVNEVPQLFDGALLGTLIWISVGIYRVSTFRPILVIFADSLSTWVQHLIVMMALVERRLGNGLFSPVQLVTKAPVDSLRWSSVDLIIRLSLAPEFLVNPNNQALFAQCIYNQFYYWALLLGLREVHDRAGIRRWQRIRKQARLNLKAYGAKSPVWDVIRSNQWHRAGNRKISLLTVHHALMVAVLFWCPTGLFFPVLRWLPKPVWGWELLSPKDGKEALVREF